jgi:PTS system ascorbate-specific IIA component
MVGILIITHDHLGQTMLDVVEQAYTHLDLPTRTLPIYPDTDPVICIEKARALVALLDQGDGVLVLTDIFGATPANIAQQLIADNVVILHGMSLPMLFRLFNYPALSLEELVDKAIAAGHDGIMHQP